MIIMDDNAHASASYIMLMVPLRPLTNESAGGLQWHTSASTIPRNGSRLTIQTQEWFNILAHILVAYCRLPHGCVYYRFERPKMSSGTTSIPGSGHDLDNAALGHYLVKSGKVPNLQLPVVTTKIGYGQSNPTYFLDDAT